MAFIPPTSSNNQLNQLVAGNKKESTKVKKKTSPDQLPTEAFPKILSFLSPENFQSIASVSTNWKKLLIESTKLVELCRFRSLASFLEGQFKYNSKLKTNQEILQHTNDAIHRSVKSLEEVIEHLPNLLLLKKRLLEDKDSTVAILQNLEKDDISALKTQAYGVDTPEGVFELADAYKKADELLDETLKITNTQERNKKLLVIPKSLSEKGYFEKAIEIANRIPIDLYKSEALSRISIAVLESGDHEKIANLIPDNEHKCRALSRISNAAKIRGDHEKAVKIANLIPDNKYKSEALSDISMAVLKSEGHEKAIKIANLIPDNEDKYIALSKISMAILESGDYGEAIKIANFIPDNEHKYIGLSKISMAILESGDHGEAIKIANLMPDKLHYCEDHEYKSGPFSNEYKYRALSKISIAVLESGDHEKALKLANLIPLKDLKDKALYKISMALLESGDHEKAIKGVNLIQGEIFIFGEKPRLCSPVSEISKSLFEEISNTLHENKNIGKALKLANLIPLKDLKDKALSEISSAVMKSGDHEEAIKIANLIPDDLCKSEALSEISSAVMKSGDHEEAIKIANLIPDGFYKYIALFKISQILN